jgi:antiviral helicase SKI2
MPARTVVFSGTRKHDGRSFRDLTPGEMTQMAGRAGRRGLDATGTVIIVTSPDEFPDVHPVSILLTQTASLNRMILGQPTKLQSQFRLTYNMILNLLRVEALKVEEMIKRSFSEHATQSLLPDQEKKIATEEETLKQFQKKTCPFCDVDLSALHNACVEVIRYGHEMLWRALMTPSGRRLLSPGRVIIIHKEVHPRSMTRTLASDSNPGGHNGPRTKLCVQCGQTQLCQRRESSKYDRYLNQLIQVTGLLMSLLCISSCSSSPWTVRP